MEETLGGNDTALGAPLTPADIARLVREEHAKIKAEEQAACSHARSATLIDGKTGLVRCDDCGLDYMCNKPHVGGASAVRPEPSPIELEAIEAMRKRALGGDTRPPMVGGEE